MELFLLDELMYYSYFLDTVKLSFVLLEVFENRRRYEYSDEPCIFFACVRGYNCNIIDRLHLFVREKSALFSIFSDHFSEFSLFGGHYDLIDFFLPHCNDCNYVSNNAIYSGDLELVKRFPKLSEFADLEEHVYISSLFIDNKEIIEYFNLSSFSYDYDILKVFIKYYSKLYRKCCKVSLKNFQSSGSLYQFVRVNNLKKLKKIPFISPSLKQVYISQAKEYDYQEIVDYLESAKIKTV